MTKLQSRAFVMAVCEPMEVPVVLLRVLADDYELRARIATSRVFSSIIVELSVRYCPSVSRCRESR
jgi:hypothetical protein